MHALCTSGFVNDVTFSHNDQAQTTQLGQSDSPGAAPGTKCDVYDWRVLFAVAKVLKTAVVHKGIVCQLHI